MTIYNAHNSKILDKNKCETEFEQGHRLGFALGYETGKEDGRRKTLKEIIANLKTLMQSNATKTSSDKIIDPNLKDTDDLGYDAGYDVGYDAGFSDGCTEGCNNEEYERGYNDGYIKGSKETNIKIKGEQNDGEKT